MTASETSAPKERRIFISYRRSDCQPQANAINDGLRHRLQPAKIFMDIDSIPAGVDFAQHIREEIEVCDVVLVLIGDDWLTATDAQGRRRIDNPDDFVRLEIENAFASPRVSVVPVLVEGAEMPSAADIPESIRRLTRINAIELSDKRWTSDIERLAQEIKRLEKYQEARAKRSESGASPAAATSPPASTPAAPATPATPTMQLADVQAEAVAVVVRSLPDVFHTKDVSEHEYTRHAHGSRAEARNYHSIIGQYLRTYEKSLGIQYEGESRGDRGATWRRSHVPVVGFAGPTSPHPAHSAQPPGVAAGQVHRPLPGSHADSQTLGWIMVAIPVLCCGFLSFVPSLWVAYERRSDKRLLVRSLAAAAAFFVVALVGMILIGTSPKDAEGNIAGVQGNVGVAILLAGGVVASALALFQRDPREALRQTGEV